MGPKRIALTLKIIIAALALFCLNNYLYYFRSPSKEGKCIDHVLSQASKKIMEDHSLSPGGKSICAMYEIKSLGLMFRCYRELTVDEARAMVVSCANTLLKTINDYEPIRPYLHAYPFPSDRIEISINLFPQNSGNVKDGKISYVSLDNNKICYDTDSQSKPQLETIYSETYEEAVEKLKTQHEATSTQLTSICKRPSKLEYAAKPSSRHKLSRKVPFSPYARKTSPETSSCLVIASKMQPTREM